MGRYLTTALWIAAVVHLAFGVAGIAFPRAFYAILPPWPPLHVGQIQIGGVFDVTLAVLFFVGATDLDRYLPIVVPVGVVAEWGHAWVRIGHVLAGDDPRDDLLAPILMLLFGLALLGMGWATWDARAAYRARHPDGAQRASPMR